MLTKRDEVMCYQLAPEPEEQRTCVCDDANYRPPAAMSE
jgi:hypothetical protein